MSGSTKFCRYCREEIPVDSEFCEKCGRVLTPKKETPTSLPKKEVAVASQTPRSAKRVLLGVLIIAILLAGVIAISYVPNPWVKNHTWISVEGATWDAYSDNNYESFNMEFFLLVSIHNPTHHTYQIGVNPASLKGELQGWGNTPSLEDVSFDYLGSELWTGTEWMESASFQLHPCSPALLSIDFFSIVNQYQYAKGTFHLNLALTINGVTTTSTDDFTETFSPITQTTTQTTTTSQMPYEAPDECVLPWV